MKNGDLPAMPIVYEVEYPSSIGYEKRAEIEFGLTKREQFAMAAMQGLLVNMGRNGIDSVKQVAEHAACAADALLAELELRK